MWREKGKSLNYHQRVYFRNINKIRKSTNQRLHFPVKEQLYGYTGKKQFTNKYKDQVILAPHSQQKIHRIDKLKVDDIQGASPNLNIQPINNKNKHIRKSKSIKTLSNTEPIDSLQLLIRENNKDKDKKITNTNTNRYQQQSTKKLKTQGNKEQLRSRNLQLSKNNIFGVWDYNPQIYRQKLQKYKKNKLLINPTYLSSLKII